MKEMVALLLAVGLIAVGWEKSYKEHYIFLATMLSAGRTPAGPAANSYPAAPAAHSDASWMWEKSKLDSTKQSGVDRSGVHTHEPLLHQ